MTTLEAIRAALPAYPIEVAFPDISRWRAGNSGIDYLHTFDSGQPGKHVMILALTHGNEVSGAIAVDALLAAPEEQRPRVLEQAVQAHAPAPAGPKGGAPRRTPGEQLVADAWAMKRLAVRLQTRLLERSLTSLGEASCAMVSGELRELRRALASLTTSLDSRLGAAAGTPGAPDAAH